MARNPRKRTRIEEARLVLEKDIWEFAKYINPNYCYGDIHEECFRWLADQKGNDDNQLLLMPRAHLKSHLIAVWCAWWITKNPATSIVYLSAGEDLASAQISAVKRMLTSDRYRRLWPEMINKEEAKRDKWTAWSFNVDHPHRYNMGTRDLTFLIKTVKSNFTGLHCDVMVFDDIVVPSNAYTETGRREVKAAVSQCASIKNPGAVTKAVGTIYHPSDIYNDFKEAKVKEWNEELGDFDKEIPLWSIREYEVEDHGDMTGTYLWPRTINPVDNKGYGFNIKILASIQAQYFSLGENAQFYAQYYNRPNDPHSEKVSRESFQFYDPKFITFTNGHYYFNGKKLNLSAAMDVAWTVNKGSDYTALTVIGVDAEWNIYVLALERFKTQDYEVYYKNVESLYQHYGFRKLYIESNAGGTLVASEIKRRLRQNGVTLQVIGKAATGHEGKKEEKHNAILIPRVKNGQVFFAKGGLTQVAIEEIVLERPPHDDLKDVLTAAIVNATPASRGDSFTQNTVVPLRFNRRFGGRVRG